MVQEAELGERIMRALILRRVGLLRERRRRADHRRPRRQRRRAAAARLPRPQRPAAPACSMPTAIACAKTLIERFHVDPHHLPIVLCPNGKLLRNPERERAGALHRPGAADRSATSSMTSRSSAPGRPGWQPRSMRRRKGCRRSCSTAAPSADRPARRRASRTISAFRPAFPGMALMARAYNQAQKFGVEMAIPDEAMLLGDARRCGRRHYTLDVGDGETRARARGGDRQRRALPPPRRARTSRSSRDRACTTGPRRSRHGCAAARRWRWSAPAIRPARRRSIWPAR